MKDCKRHSIHVIIVHMWSYSDVVKRQKTNCSFVTSRTRLSRYKWQALMDVLSARTLTCQEDGVHCRSMGLHGDTMLCITDFGRCCNYCCCRCCCHSCCCCCLYPGLLSFLQFGSDLFFTKLRWTQFPSNMPRFVLVYKWWVLLAVCYLPCVPHSVVLVCGGRYIWWWLWSSYLKP